MLFFAVFEKICFDFDSQHVKFTIPDIFEQRSRYIARTKQNHDNFICDVINIQLNGHN